MKHTSTLQVIFTLVSALSLPLQAELLKSTPQSKLVQTAEQELSNKQTQVPSPEKTPLIKPLSTSVVPDTPKPSFLVANKPSLQNSATRPSWFASLGLENQKPQGLLSIDGLSPVDLASLETKNSFVFQLDWWFVRGARWSSGLFAETSWSQHAYDVEVTSNRIDSEAVLDVFRAALGAQARLSLDDWLPVSFTKPGISYAFGSHFALGRLIQVQSSEDLSLLNRSLSLNHGDWGPHLSVLFANKFLVDLSYSRRWAVDSTYEPSNHAQLSFGMSL